jgi:hypothetical protein
MFNHDPECARVDRLEGGILDHVHDTSDQTTTEAMDISCEPEAGSISGYPLFTALVAANSQGKRSDIRLLIPY